MPKTGICKYAGTFFYAFNRFSGLSVLVFILCLTTCQYLMIISQHLIDNQNFIRFTRVIQPWNSGLNNH